HTALNTLATSPRLHHRVVELIRAITDRHDHSSTSHSDEPGDDEDEEEAEEDCDDEEEEEGDEVPPRSTQDPARMRMLNDFLAAHPTLKPVFDEALESVYAITEKNQLDERDHAAEARALRNSPNRPKSALTSGKDQTPSTPGSAYKRRHIVFGTHSTSRGLDTSLVSPPPLPSSNVKSRGGLASGSRGQLSGKLGSANKYWSARRPAWKYP
ncbi:hypothetical protein HK102_007683, partial [Quaeritorhiza haematococci]